nr:nardilysin-like isoform X1 [Ipomoea batatas]GMD09348.1 nardilysin-like isoform X1 [Ipomoea batatas]
MPLPRSIATADTALASATADDRDSVAKPAAADNDPELLVRGRLETPIWKAGKLYWLEADRQLKMFISFLWTLPSLRKDYLRKDEDSLAHLLGHGKAFWTWLSTYAADICTIVTAGDIRIKSRTSSKISTYWRYCMIWELSAISIIRRNRGIQGSPRYARYDL